MQLPLQTRHKIAAIFNIPKTGPTEVFDNTIKSDGYPIKEIEERINLLSMQMYLETKETDMSLLWTWMVEKIEGRPLTRVNIDTTLAEQRRKEVLYDREILVRQAIEETPALDKALHTDYKKTHTPLGKPKRGRKPKAK